MKYSTWVQSQKQQNLNSLPKQTVQHHSNPSLRPNHWCWRSLSWQVLWRSTSPSRTNTKKDTLFIKGDWNTKVGSKETQKNRQVWPWSTKCSRSEANRVLSRKHAAHSKHSFPTQETIVHMDITRWSILKSDSSCSLQPKMKKLYIVSENKTGSWLWLRSWTPYCKIQA